MSSSFPYAAFAQKLHHLLEAGQGEAAWHKLSILVSATVDIPPVEPALLFGWAQGQERILWEQPSQQFSMVAFGATAWLTGHGERRFSQIAAGWHGLVSRALVDAAPSCPLAPPLSLGGFAFDPDGHADPGWEGYPDALLVIPRFLFMSCGSSSWLSVNVLMASGCDIQATTTAVLGDLHELLSEELTARGEEHPERLLVLEDEAEVARWKATTVSIVREIERGAIEKLVLARNVRARSSRLIDPGLVIHRLRARYGRCTLFAFTRGQSCFVGATPERLVRLEGTNVWADCLAGSASRGATHDDDCSLGEALLADRKERREHALVVRALQNVLSPLCAQLTVPEAPSLLRMPNVQHLRTPLRGMLKEEHDIFGLIERLHPTPATGGLPREMACSLLRTYECLARGWYAGPVGWVDGHGGGEFVVAIRSALLRGHEARLYAGCGIVAGSDPEREYEESCLKLRPMLWALNGT
jgi:isochorismate synthase